MTGPLVPADADDPHEIIVMVVPALPPDVTSAHFTLDTGSDSTLIGPGEGQPPGPEDIAAELARLVRANPGHIFTMTLRNTITGRLITRDMN
ncbi:hypothetical protein GCM10009733_020490 [Nonomuraea maheshkhaliensis]|uniref:Peptidase A2 domain-containing protein n=1 Tax=Nonomuraea maheshkhaliensis TaxID=419590 RepID=A0ABP4QUR1_9ACTN